MTKFDEYWREFNSQSAGGAFRYPECDCVAQFRWMARSLGGALTSRQAAEALCLMRSASVEKMEVFAGVPGLLAQLRAGGAKLYLLTNAQHAFTYKEIEMCGLAHTFDGIAVSSEYGVRKPDPAFFAAMFDKYGLKKSESVMIGDDAVSDGEGAAEFGIRFIHAKGGAAAHADEIMALLEK